MHEQELVANSVVGLSFLIDYREVLIFSAYGIPPDMFFLLKWKDTDMFFCQDFYTVISLVAEQ